MKTFSNFLLVFSLILSAAALSGQDEIRSAGEKIIFSSQYFDHDKAIRIHLPASYDSSSKVYPVLFVTDAEEQFSMAAGIEPFLSDTMTAPELIIVGIPHADRYEELSYEAYSGSNEMDKKIFARSGKGAGLTAFLKEELIPYMDRNYRTAPFRILFGHSMGGLYAADVYLREPALFQSYIASDPALHYNFRASQKFAKKLDKNSPRFDSMLFMSTSDVPFMEKATRAFYNTVRRRAGDRIRLTGYDNDNHMIVPLKSLLDGLKFTFKEDDLHKIPDFFPRAYDFEFMKNYYAELSERRGYEILPPPKIIKHAGFYRMNNLNRPDLAVEVFQYYVSLYPGSSLGYELLAQCCRDSGDRESAIKYCTEALRLDPHSATARRLMQTLQE